MVERRDHGEAGAPVSASGDVAAFDPDALGSPFRVAVIHDRPNYFGPFAAALKDELQARGVEILEAVKGAQTRVPDAIVVVGLHCFDPAQIRDVAGSEHAVIAGVQTEQLATPRQGAPQFGSRRLRRVLRALPICDVVFDWSAENTRWLGERHPNVQFLPYGLIEARHWSESLDAIEPRFDIGFIGSLDAVSGRRRRLLDALAHDFSVHPGPDEATGGIWGVEKIRMMKECRVVLNLHAEASAVFEAPRFFDALGAGLALISEPVHDPFPFRSGIDFAEASTLDLSAVVGQLLVDAPRRQQLAAAGQATARRNGMEVTARMVLRALLIGAHARSVRSRAAPHRRRVWFGYG